MLLYDEWENGWNVIIRNGDCCFDDILLMGKNMLGINNWEY